MKKKILIILGIVLVSILLIVGIIFGIVKSNKKEKVKEDNAIVTTITMDINPSIEINLNKEDKVVSVKALNEDSKKILSDKDFKGNSLEETMDKVVGSLIDEGYLKEESNIILINVESSNKKVSTNVEKIVNKTVSNNKIKCEVIVQSIEVTDEIKELADKYNMTPSKAYYIQEQIKDSDLKFEDFKEVSISEIKTKVEEKVNEKKEEEKNDTTNNSGGEVRTGVSDKSWQDLLDEGFLEPEGLRPIFYSKYGITEPIFGSMFSAVTDSRCKRNIAYEVEVVSYLTMHRGIMCSFGANVYDYSSRQLVSSVIGEDSAYQIALDRLVSTYGFDPETITQKRCNLGYSNVSSYMYEYNVYIATTMSGQFVARVKATNGEIIEAYKW